MESESNKEDEETDSDDDFPSPSKKSRRSSESRNSSFFHTLGDNKLSVLGLGLVLARRYHRASVVISPL